MAKMESKKESIADELTSMIRRRLILALSIMSFLIIAISGVEIKNGFDELKMDVEQEAVLLKDAIISEFLVENMRGVASRLKEVRNRKKYTEVKWTPTPNALGETSMFWIFPFQWKYYITVKKLNESGSYGQLVFTGDVARDEVLLKPLMFRIVMLLVFGLIIGFIFAPLGSSAVKRFFTDRLEQLIGVVKGESNALEIFNRYEETVAVGHELRKYFEERVLFEKDRLNQQKSNAIAQTTQMLAHDVRRPFTMIQGLLGMLESTVSITQCQELIKKFSPEVNRAIVSVNGMIADVMEVGSNTVLTTKAVNPESLIETALSEVFRYDRKADVELTYDLRHRHKVNADSLKLLRVFSNIIANASQAMNRKGKIWIRTQEIIEDDKEYIEFCIGNSGSSISAEDLKNLFESFFTKGKKGGTGLGLAIAKKIITSHRGRIRCESFQEIGVEFYFTLPINLELAKAVVNSLPKSSKEISPPVARG